jgi:hypothetical protein
MRLIIASLLSCLLSQGPKGWSFVRLPCIFTIPKKMILSGALYGLGYQLVFHFNVVILLLKISEY